MVTPVSELIRLLSTCFADPICLSRGANFMFDPGHRRHFLHSTVQLAASSCAAWALSHPLASAVEPIKRKAAPQFRFSLAAYSYRKLLTGAEPEWTLHDFIDHAATMPLDAVELTSYYFRQPVEGPDLMALKRHCFVEGLDISGTAVGNDFGFPAGEKRQQQIDLVKRWVDYSSRLGAPVIRVFAGHLKPGTTPEESHRLMVEGLAECCDYAGQQGVFLALENHGGPTSTAAGLLALVRDVQSPWFGVNLDTGNFQSDDVYGELAQAAPYALNVQVKVVVRNAARQSRPADFPLLAKILRDAGYRGYIVLEYEEAEEPREACPRFVQELRTAFA
jgi:sugar phosphate isomerase/epimerase